MSDEKWRAKGVDFDLAIAKARAHLSLTEVLDVVGLGPFAILLEEEGYTQVAQLRALHFSGELADLLIGYGFSDDDVAKVTRVVGFKALEGDGDFFEDTSPPTSVDAGSAGTSIDSTVAETSPAATSFGDWTHEDCVSWLKSLPTSLGLDASAFEGQNPVETLSGTILLEAIESSRELRDTFGLRSMSSRVQFEQAVRQAAAAKTSAASLSAATRGGLYSESFLAAIEPLYNMHMGVENMGPMLYALVRFTKPRRVLEVGAGYTSMFILQALRDNADELENLESMRAAGVCDAAGTPWTVDPYFEQSSADSSPGSWGGTGVLHCVDNMAHAHTTAHKVLKAASLLGLDKHLKLHVKDAWEMCEPGEFPEEECPLDLLWIDFGAGAHLKKFFHAWWPRLNDHGGMALVHSTLTNELTRSGWLEGMRRRRGDTGRLGGAQFETMSFLEPHKLFQNSFSIIQKRGDGWAEPVYTKFP